MVPRDHWRVGIMTIRKGERKEAGRSGNGRRDPNAATENEQAFSLEATEVPVSNIRYHLVVTLVSALYPHGRTLWLSET